MIGVPELIVLLTLFGFIGGIVLVVVLIIKNNKSKNDRKG
jgi:hypothetical protein